jgi:hypothetical protein
MPRAPKNDVTNAELQAVIETVKPKAAAKKVGAKPAAAAPKKAAAPRKASAGAKAPAKTRGGAGGDTTAVSPEERYRMVQDAAYYIAEKHGFTGDNHAFWLQAEQEIDAKLAGQS